MAASPLDTINARIAAAESYKNRMQNQGKWAQFAGASAKLDNYYGERNTLLGNQAPLKTVTPQEAAAANESAVGGPSYPLGPGWVYDDERGGFTPPPEAEGSASIGGGPLQAPQPVSVTEPGDAAGAEGGPVSATEPEPWSVYTDPVYLQQLQYGQNAFNTARTNALGDKERQTLATQEELDARKPSAEQARRRLAGNYAARGMGGGRAGALTRAEAQQNAQELSARTSLRDKISELNRQFVANYGATGSDWLGTATGAEAQQNAVQAAINARLAGLTTIG